MTLTEVVLAVRAAILTEVVTILSVVSLVIEAEAEVLGQGDELLVILEVTGDIDPNQDLGGVINSLALYFNTVWPNTASHAFHTCIYVLYYSL